MIGKTCSVGEDCVGWTTAKNRKTGAIGPDANARPVDLKAGEQLEVVGVGVGVQPRTFLVVRGDVQVEVRESSLRA